VGLTFEDASITGVISATTAHNLLSPIEYPIGMGGVINEGHVYDYKYLGVVTNTASPGLNNGVIVSLMDSTWTVTGMCHLTSLTIDEGSAIVTESGGAPTAPGLHTPVARGRVEPPAGQPLQTTKYWGGHNPLTLKEAP
jgi:hypothetical protein